MIDLSLFRSPAVFGGNATNLLVGGALIIALVNVPLMTNTLFGMILIATASQGAARAWPWADNLIFWGLNLGAASFIAVLLFVGSGYNSGPFQHPVAYTASLMGLSGSASIAQCVTGSWEGGPSGA